MSGTHFSSIGKVRAWCHNSGLNVERMTGVNVKDYWELSHQSRATLLRDYVTRFAGLSMSPSVVCVARKMKPPEAS